MAKKYRFNLPIAPHGQKPFLNGSLGSFLKKKEFFIKFQDVEQWRKSRHINNDNVCT